MQQWDDKKRHKYLLYNKLTALFYLYKKAQIFNEEYT